MNSVCMHKILFLAQKLLSHCGPSGPYGTDIRFSKYGRYLGGEKEKKRENFLKKLIVS